MDLPHGIVDAAVESRQPVAAEWWCSEGAGVNPLIHNSSDLCPFIHNSFRRWLADIAVNSGADDPADVIAQSDGNAGIKKTKADRDHYFPCY